MIPTHSHLSELSSSVAAFENGKSHPPTNTLPNVNKHSATFSVDDGYTGTMEKTHFHDKFMEESRVRVCNASQLAEITALKNEVSILKKIVEEEAQARKVGDALNGEVCMRLQAYLEHEQRNGLDQKTTKIEEKFDACVSKLSEDIADLRLSLEAEVLVRLQGHEKLETQLHTDASNTMRSLRLQVEHEVNHRMTDVEGIRRSLKEQAAGAFSGPSAEAFADCQRKVQEHEVSIINERNERQKEDMSLHQILQSLTEQTNLIMEEESSRLWEGLLSHKHDMGGMQNAQKVSLPTIKKPPQKVQVGSASRGIGGELGAASRGIGGEMGSYAKVHGASTLSSQKPPVSTLAGFCNVNASVTPHQRTETSARIAWPRKG